MFFKLSLKNIKNSFKNYTIYFLTLMLGVAIFYIFNSMDSQQAMLELSESTREIIKLMLEILAGVSIFISFVLGFLIVYANNFLIKRRKKEFGIYMTLGMGKRKISRIILTETLLIGLLSLAVGLVVGIFGSQLMSILVAKLFEADMSNYQFIFSKASLIKTILYFSIMYLFVVIFNTIAISRYKLIDLITAIKKSEKVKLKNPILSVIIFILSICILSYAYYNVTSDAMELSRDSMFFQIGLGILGTFMFFWSLSGFLMRIIQSMKKIYLNGLNMFVLRQINSKINTTVVSISIICLMLFVTICVLSSAISLNNSMKMDLQELTPVDFTGGKRLSGDSSVYGYEINEKTVEQVFKEKGMVIDEIFKEYEEVIVYTSETVTLKDTLGNTLEKTKEQFPYMITSGLDGIIPISEYNKVAKLYGHEELTINDNEYIMLCDYDNMKNFRDMALEEGTKINIDGKEYTPKYKECLPRFIEISTNHTNMGLIVVPDDAVSKIQKSRSYFNGKYNANTEEEKKAIEQKLLTYKNKGLEGITGSSKIAIYEASTGLGATVTFIALYIGIIFLISGAAILALKELSESTDNKERYNILRKIGADERMINKALFVQIGIFFLLPLLLAIIHSIFGIQFADFILTSFANQKGMLPSIIVTALFIVFIYGGYFIATYIGSKNIIKE